MAVWSPLTTGWAVTTDCDLRTSQVDSFGNHHAASTSLAVVLAAMQPGGREVSSNYVIHKRDIIGVVPEDYRAWTSGSARDDDRAITVEIVNSSGSPYWQFDPETVESVVALNADIMRRYNVPAQHGLPGIWEHRNLYEWFGRSYPTACAGPSFDIGSIISSAAAKNQNHNPVRPEEEDEIMSRPICIAKNTGKGNEVEVTIFNFDTGEEHSFASSRDTTGNAYNTNVAITYGCAPQVPISYVSTSHYDKIKAENAATRKRLAV